MTYLLQDELTNYTWLNESIDRKDGKYKRMKAVDVFAAVIAYFKGLIMNKLLTGSRKNAFSNDDIHWVLTIPFFGDQNARQFTCDAAAKVCRSVPF